MLFLNLRFQLQVEPQQRFDNLRPRPLLGCTFRARDPRVARSPRAARWRCEVFVLREVTWSCLLVSRSFNHQLSSCLPEVFYCVHQRVSYYLQSHFVLSPRLNNLYLQAHTPQLHHLTFGRVSTFHRSSVRSTHNNTRLSQTRRQGGAKKGLWKVRSTQERVGGRQPSRICLHLLLRHGRRSGCCACYQWPRGLRVSCTCGTVTN